MVKVKPIIIAGGLLAAGIIAFFIFFQSEAAKVIKQFEFIAEIIEKAPGENHIIAVAKVAKVEKVFTESFEIHAPAHSFSRIITPDELATFILSKRSQYSQISLKFYDFVIDFPEQDIAQVSLTASMQGKFITEESFEDLHELKCQMQKIGNIWLFKEVEVVEVLRK